MQDGRARDVATAGPRLGQEGGHTRILRPHNQQGLRVQEMPGPLQQRQNESKILTNLYTLKQIDARHIALAVCSRVRANIT